MNQSTLPGEPASGLPESCPIKHILQVMDVSSSAEIGDEQNPAEPQLHVQFVLPAIYSQSTSTSMCCCCLIQTIKTN